MNFSYDVSVENGGGKFLKVGHFYKGIITRVTVNNGFVNVYIKSEGGETVDKDGIDYSSLSQKIGIEYTQKTVSQWAYAVVCSNTEEGSPERTKHLEAIRVGFNPENWVDRKIGFVCEPQFSKDPTKNGKFAEPKYARDWHEHENGTCVDEGKYKLWEEKSKAMKNIAPTAGFGATPPAGLPVEDELPF